MPLGKYYCDYCEKQFQDTPSARKRHLHGAAHLRARALWFDSFKQHSSRPPHAFPQTPVAGTTHGINASLPLLHRHPDGTFASAAAAAAAKGLCHHFVRTGICRYGDSCKYYHPATAAASGDMAREKMALWGHLPASLQPPPEGGYPPLPFVDWG